MESTAVFSDSGVLRSNGSHPTVTHPLPPPPPTSSSSGGGGGLLGSFLRSRPTRVPSSQPQPQPPPDTHDAQMPLIPNRPPPPAMPTIATTLPHPSTSTSSTGFGHILRRRRSGGQVSPSVPSAPPVAPPPAPRPAPSLPAPPQQQQQQDAHALGPSHRLRLVPQIDNRRSLRFDPIARDVPEGASALRIGRFTDRSGLGVAAANALGSNKLAFKSKVVSRAHAEIWCERGGKFFIRDTKSSSGTFLNHVRLSAANTDSRPFELKDGDTLQLGVDYQGGAEDIYKCVRIRVEIGREWQASANAFNTNALKQLKALSHPGAAAGATTTKKPGGVGAPTKSGFSDCCICLFSVTIQQALFIAPCSHSFHYKCIRPLLEAHHPAFSCPLCRTFADLEEDVEIDAPSLAPSADEEEEEVGGGGQAMIEEVASPRRPIRDGAETEHDEDDADAEDADAEMADVFDAHAHGHGHGGQILVPVQAMTAVTTTDHPDGVPEDPAPAYDDVAAAAAASSAYAAGGQYGDRSRSLSPGVGDDIVVGEGAERAKRRR